MVIESSFIVCLLEWDNISLIKIAFLTFYVDQFLVKQPFWKRHSLWILITPNKVISSLYKSVSTGEVSSTPEWAKPRSFRYSTIKVCSLWDIWIQFSDLALLGHNYPLSVLLYHRYLIRNVLYNIECCKLIKQSTNPKYKIKNHPH